MCERQKPRHPQPSGGGGTPFSWQRWGRFMRTVPFELKEYFPHVFLIQKVFIYHLLSAKQSDGEHAAVCGCRACGCREGRGRIFRKREPCEKGRFLIAV